MEKIIHQFFSLFSDEVIVLNNIVISGHVLKLLFLTVVAGLIHFVNTKLILHFIKMVIKRKKTVVRDALSKGKILNRTFHLIPAVILSIGLPLIIHEHNEFYDLASKILSLYYIYIVLAIFDSILTFLYSIYEDSTKSKKIGFTGVIQALKILGLIIAIILAISVLADKSPVILLSGIGAFTAILMLIFRDPILGLIAGLQLSAMDLVRKGDWIDIPKHGADGQVDDITLTTVKVRNWDMTLTAIPAYELIASSFKNWRGMFESGGRRIKRSLRFSARSIRFLTDEEIENLRRVKLLTPYIEQKITEICNFNAATFSADDMSIQTNGRRLTNLGTYRAYCDAYLRSHPGINNNMMIMVRQLHPTEFGLPLEIYAFTSDVVWTKHENTQSDIFDHLIAIIPEFGLEIYQR
jgi:miniconductance mechanosensitive channel